MRVVLIFLFVCLIAVPVASWNSTGHRIIASIALGSLPRLTGDGSEYVVEVAIAAKE
jgi:hypothetical protein